MTLIGFNFTKINAERKTAAGHNIRIENNVGIVNVSEGSVIDPKKAVIKYDFQFVCKYEPGMGIIELKGELVEIYDKEYGAKIMDYWKAEKKVHKEVVSLILNNILSKANIEAIIISKEIGLPSPIAMPKVDIKPKLPETKPEAKSAESKPAETKGKKK